MVLADWWDRVAGRAGKREVFPSRFGEAAVYAMPAEDGSLVRMLNVGGVLQSATYLDERWATCPFAYLRSFDHLFEAALSEAPDPLVVNRVLMLGGAVGNMIDRFVTGYVVDMFEILLFRFAIFNVADVALTVGAILLGITLLWIPKEWSEKTHGDANDSAV